MDKEYLQNMIGSPYMNEGVLSRALSKGISGVGKFLNKSLSPQTQTHSQTPPQHPTQGGTNSDSIVKNDLAFIIDKTIDIIIKTVKSDVSHAGPFLSDDPTKQKPLPQSWEEPSLTKEANAPQQPDGKEDEEEDEIEGEFLYNFGSKYRKIHTFSIEVGNEKVKLPSGKEVNLKVIWHNKDWKNLIYTQTKKGGEPVTQALLFKFYDDQVNPRNDAGKNFDVSLLLKQAQPNQPYALDPNIINPQILQSIGSKKENLLRAFYATTTRKAMEFKSKKKDSISLTADDEGNVWEYDKKEKKYLPPLTPDKVKANLYGPDSQKWYDALEHISYFKEHPEIKPKSPETFKPYNDAILTLIALGNFNKIESGELAKTAWNNFISAGKSPDQISAEDITKAVLKGTNKTPATPTTTPTTPTTPVSSPAGSPPEPSKVSAPVSKEPESAKVSSEPTTPVSNAGKIEKKSEQPQGKVGDISQTGDGFTWQTKNGPVYVSPEKAVRLKNNPNFISSLIYARLLKKYVVMLDQHEKEVKKKKKLQETYTKHGNFNPWNKSNFLP
jgi:hypothetical protein